MCVRIDFQYKKKHITHVIVVGFDNQVTSNATIVMPQLSLSKLKKTYITAKHNITTRQQTINTENKYNNTR